MNRIVISLVVVAIVLAAFFFGRGFRDIEKPTNQKYPYVFYTQERIIADSETYFGFTVHNDIVVTDLRSSETLLITTDGFKKRFSISPDGLIYYDVGEKDKESIWVINLKKKTQYPFVRSNGYISGSTASQYQHFAANPAVSPDGKNILFEGNQTTFRTIFCINSDGTGLRMVTRGAGAHCGSPSWSPDGKYIAYDCLPYSDNGQYGDFSIWVMQENGVDEKMVFSQTGTNNHRPTWRPKGGRWLLFYSMIGDEYGIRAILLDSKNEVKRIVKVADDGYNNINPRWSPDGKYIIYQSNRAYAKSYNKLVDDYDIYCIEFDPDLPRKPVPVSKQKMHEVNPCWAVINDNKVWGKNLLGYLSDGIVLDSTKSGPGI